MLSKILTATGLALALALPAAAQSTQSQSSGSSSSGQQSGKSGQSSQNTMAVRQHVKQDLEKSGFTDVQVMPESFLVRAKDKEGRPVMMVINPDSITAVTQMGGSSQSGSSGSSSGSGSGGSSSTK